MHSLVQATFDPHASAYWLPQVGRETAARIPTRRFWALRANLELDDLDNPAPPYLFLLSNKPSPYPFPQASLSIGPKCTLPARELSQTDAELLVRPPIPTKEDSRQKPVYLHTVPSLNCNRLFNPRIKRAFFRLKADHLQRFIDTAYEAIELAQEYRLLGSRAFPRKVPGNKGISTNRPIPLATHLTYVFGELHDPKSYVFKYGNVDELTYPERLEPTLLYEHILIYNQICIDYRWRDVDATIDWVKISRKEDSPPWYPVLQSQRIRANVTSSSAIQQANAEALWAGEDLFFDVDAERDSDSERYLPFAFPKLAYEYPRVALGRPKVIAFDVFGALLDRTGAIQRALASWASYVPPGLEIQDLVALYIELEARSAHERRSQACSLAAIVRFALLQLATGLRIPDDRRSAYILDAGGIILKPDPFPGVVNALTFLARHRFTLVCIPSYSESTLQHLSHAFPDHLTSILHVCPAVASPHFASPGIFDALLRQCNDIVPGGVRPREILLVSNGIGRILAPATARGYATALIRRPGCLEASVNFKVGKGAATPTPSITVDGFSGLCRELRQFTFLVPDESENAPSSSDDPDKGGKLHADSSASSREAGASTSRRVDEDPDTTRYIWSFTICGVYQATQFLGEGAKAYVFRAFHTLTGTEVAAKIEATPVAQGKRPFLEHEIAIYKMLCGAPPGIPVVHWSGRDGNYAVLIMGRLGPNLSALRRFCRGVFTMRTICMLAEQMLSRLEFVHSRGIVVCDVKPQNFAMGRGANANVLYLLDFGHAALYIDPATRAHIPPDRRRHAVGTVRYMSVAAHMRQAISRRDDIESLLYVLVELYKGTLPWKDIHHSRVDDVETQERRIRESKAGEPFASLLAELPPEFADYHAHCAVLPFGAAPDYAYLRELFRARMYVQGWGPESEYDWMCGGSVERGTLIPEEYVLDLGLCCADVDLEPI